MNKVNKMNVQGWQVQVCTLQLKYGIHAFVRTAKE